MEKNYFSGIVGGLIGGFICSIPWLFTYVQLEMILSILALLIGIGVLKGYQLFKGKVSKSLPLIVMVISIFIVVFETLFVIPLCLAAKEGYQVSIEILKYFYSFSDFTSSIIKDCLLALVFTVLGVSGVSSSIKKQLEAGNEDTIVFGGERANMTRNEQAVKDFFLSKGATNWENSIVVDYSSGLNQEAFLELERNGVVKNFNGSYYYSVDDELRVAEQQQQAQKNSSKKGVVIGLIVAAAVILGVVAVMLFGGNGGSTGGQTVKFDNHQFTVADGYDVEEDESEEGVWYIYEKEDYDIENGYISISYYADDTYEYSEEEYEYFVEVFGSYNDVKVESDRVYELKNGGTAIELVLHVAGEEDGEVYDYYDVVEIVYAKTEMFFIESIADTKKQCNSLYDGSMILDTLK